MWESRRPHPLMCCSQGSPSPCRSLSFGCHQRSSRLPGTAAAAGMGVTCLFSAGINFKLYSCPCPGENENGWVSPRYHHSDQGQRRAPHLALVHQTPGRKFCFESTREYLFHNQLWGRLSAQEIKVLLCAVSEAGPSILLSPLNTLSCCK